MSTKQFCQIIFTSAVFAGFSIAQHPHATPEGFDLPNGWKISPVGKAVGTEDLLLKVIAAPDGRVVIGTHGGYDPHGLVVVDAKTHEATQRIGLKSAWLGLAWSRDGRKLFASGGN